MPSVSCCSRRLACSGPVSCELFVKTGTPHDGGVDGPSPGGGATLLQGGFSTPTGWLDKPLAISMFAKSAYITIERKFVSLVQINI